MSREHEEDDKERRREGDGEVTSELVFDTYEAAALPDDAIISEGETTYVYTVEDGTARRTKVEVRPSGSGRTESASGLALDVRAVVTGWDTLRDGAPVEVAEGELPQQALH